MNPTATTRPQTRTGRRRASVALAVAAAAGLALSACSADPADDSAGAPAEQAVTSSSSSTLTSPPATPASEPTAAPAPAVAAVPSPAAASASAPQLPANVVGTGGPCHTVGEVAQSEDGAALFCTNDPVVGPIWQLAGGEDAGAGQATPGGIDVGPLRFPVNGHVLPSGPNGRVQALFRPEDVEIAPSAALLNCPPLGQGQVEEILFSGPYERLRIRLPAVTGVRSISPPLSFGGDSLVVEATRTQEQARSYPLQPGEQVWLGVGHIHALDHPGLRFLVLADGTPESKAGLQAAGRLAGLAHARVLLLIYGGEQEATEESLQEAKALLGSGLASLDVRAGHGPLAELIAREVERQPVDLVIAAANGPMNPNSSMLTDTAREIVARSHPNASCSGTISTPSRMSSAPPMMLTVRMWCRMNAVAEVAQPKPSATRRNGMPRPSEYATPSSAARHGSPSVQLTLMIAAVLLLTSLLIDIFTALLDPRVRFDL